MISSISRVVRDEETTNEEEKKDQQLTIGQTE
jgi:hypothetical protein